jgi:hypothetical protein
VEQRIREFCTDQLDKRLSATYWLRNQTFPFGKDPVMPVIENEYT